MSATEAHERAPMLLRVADVQRETGLARAFVYRLISDGDLRSVRIGRAIRVRRVDLEKFIEDRLDAGDAA